MKKKVILLVILFLVSINNIYAKEIVEYSDCVDGDTIKIVLNNKKYTVRMLAVDTPESVHPTKEVEYYGKEASEYTCKLVKNAKKLEVEYDPASDKTDKYDRLLVWVFVDGELLQKKLIQNGYAKVAYLYGNYMYTDELKQVQELASAKNLGIWNSEAKEEYIKNNPNLDSEETTTTNQEDTSKASTSVTKTAEYTTKDIIIITVLLLVMVFVGDKTIKRKAKTHLKKYLK